MPEAAAGRGGGYRRRQQQHVLALLLACALAPAFSVAADAPPEWQAQADVQVASAQPAFLQLCFGGGGGGSTYPFPINTGNFCGSLGLSQPGNDSACGVLGTIESLQTSASVAQLLCMAPNSSAEAGWLMAQPVDAKGRHTPQPLPDRRSGGVLPAAFSGADAAAVMDSEGGAFFFWYKTLTRLAFWAPCRALGTRQQWIKPTRWALEATLSLAQDLSEYGDPAAKSSGLPMVVVLSQAQRDRARGCRAYAAGAGGGAGRLCEGGHVAVLVRGSLSAAEWKLDFNYKTAKAPAYGPGEVHAGFASAADQLWPGVQAALDAQVLQGPARHVTFAGHSLGAAVAQLLAARAQAYLAAKAAALPTWQAWPGKQPVVSAVLFGSPAVGDAAWSATFNSRINARALEYEHDFIAQVPCSPRTAACPSTTVPTGSLGGAWAYVGTGGVLAFGASEMPLQQQAWGKLQTYTLDSFCKSPGSIKSLSQAAHVCSYMCRLAAYAGGGGAGGAVRDWCLLWPAEGGEAALGTYCMAGSGRTPFPQTTPLFPPKG